VADRGGLPACQAVAACQAGKPGKKPGNGPQRSRPRSKKVPQRRDIAPNMPAPLKKPPKRKNAVNRG